MVKFSVKKPLTVFVAVLAVLVLGVVAYLKMTPDLLPNMDFPYVVIVTTDPGASPEAVESAVTRPMEQSMSTLDRIKSVTSTSQDSVSMVVLEFEDGVNMDTVSVDIQQKINMLEGNWDDGVGTPYVLKINPSMLPVQVAAVSYSGKDVTELSDFVENTLTQKLEGISGVASVTVSGTVQRQAHIILSQEKLDALTATLREAIGKTLDETASQLEGTRSQLESAKGAIRSTEESAVREAAMQALTAVQQSLTTLRSSQSRLEANLKELAEIQALAVSSPAGNPRRTSNGFDYNRFAMLLAVLEKRGGLKVSACDAYLNIIGGLSLDEPAADLAAVIALASSYLDRPVPADLVAIGEVGLTGELRSVSQLGQRVSEVRRLGFTQCLIPSRRTGELAAPAGLRLIPVRNIGEAIRAALRPSE